MRTRTYTALLVLVLTLGLTFVPNIFAAKAQGFLSVQGTWIVDSSGRFVILRGVNYSGYEWQDPLMHSESDYERLASFGFSIVRLPITWGNLEPYPGMFYDSYLAGYVDRDIRWAKKYGLYVVLDMHQYNWAAKFGGGGAPDWAVTQYPPTNAGMRQAVTDFWSQTPLQDHLVAIWTKVARRYANEPTVVGYDILNEPWIYNSIADLNGSHVNAFYVKVIKSIRTIDPNHIIFLEPANMQEYEFPLKGKIVWSPHFYTLSFNKHYYRSNASLLEADIEAKYQKFVVEMASPMWIGEFGAFMKDGSSDQWLQDAVRAFGKYQIGWAWWTMNGRSGAIPNSVYASLANQTSPTPVLVQRTTTTVLKQVETIETTARSEEPYSDLILAAALAVVMIMILVTVRRHRQR